MSQPLKKSMSCSDLLERGQRQIKLMHREKKGGFLTESFYSNRRGRKEGEYDIYDMLDKQKTFTPMQWLTDSINPSSLSLSISLQNPSPI